LRLMNEEVLCAAKILDEIHASKTMFMARIVPGLLTSSIYTIRERVATKVCRLSGQSNVARRLEADLVVGLQLFGWDLGEDQP